MSDLYMGKYRIPSARLQTWNYANMGMYFITICTQPRNNFFGDVINGEMRLNQLGKFAMDEWIRTPLIRPDMNIDLGEFVIMPDHVHMIFNIGPNEYNHGIGIKIVGVDWVGNGGVPRRDAMHRVSTGNNRDTSIINQIDIMNDPNESQNNRHTSINNQIDIMNDPNDSQNNHDPSFNHPLDSIHNPNVTSNNPATSKNTPNIR